ncbi:MAG: RIP metalloprotease RseP [Alphaproteobacteria bacterium]|nr:RIP metalloprotease RseP [Alphaproteobacteria bacterium]
MSFIYYIISFFIIINVIVFVHEFGHFLAARRCGVKVSTFSLGMGPELFGVTDKQGTRWCLSAFPVGGYVMMLGDGDISSSTKDKNTMKELTPEEKAQSFCAKSNLEKMWIGFCGPLFNYVYAFIVVLGMSWFYGIPTYSPVIADVLESSPAAEAGLLSGDKVLFLDDQKIENFRDINVRILHSDNETIKFTIERHGDVRDIYVTPKIEEVKKVWGTKSVKKVGIARGNYELVRKGFFDSIKVAVLTCWNSTVEMFGMFGRLFSGKSSLDNFGGIVQMTKVAGGLAQSGDFSMLVMFTVMLSLNLGFINLFPLPVLDGGGILINFVEQISGRKLNEKFQEYLMISCAVLLIFLMLVTTVNDILNIESIGKFVSGLMR